MPGISLSSNIAYLFQQLAFILESQSDQILQEQLGIGFSQYKILRALHINAQVRQKQLASSLFQTEASVSRQVKLLREKGYLVSRVNPKNRREHFTLPTTKGLRVTEAAALLLEKYYEGLFSHLDQKQQQYVINILLSLYQPLVNSTSINHRHLWENMI